jgi:hypothetical protein
MNTPTCITTAIDRLERKCESLTKTIDFHNSMMNHHQKQLNNISANMEIRRELRIKALSRLEVNKERLLALKKARDNINAV